MPPGCATVETTGSCSSLSFQTALFGGKVSLHMIRARFEYELMLYRTYQLWFYGLQTHLASLELRDRGCSDAGRHKV